MINFVSDIFPLLISISVIDNILLLYLVTDMRAYKPINFLLHYVVLYWEHEMSKFLSYLILHVFFSIEFVVASFKSCKETDALTFYNTIVKSLFDIRELVDKTHTKPAAKLWYVTDDLVHGVCIKTCLVYI